MEKERQIRPPDNLKREGHDRPRSSPVNSTHDAASSTRLKRPATAHHVGTFNSNSEITIHRGKNKDDRQSVLHTGAGSSQKDIDDMNDAKGQGEEFIIINDVRSSKVDAGWEEETVTDDNQAKAQSKLDDSQTQPDSDPHKYCKRMQQCLLASFSGSFQLFNVHEKKCFHCETLKSWVWSAAETHNSCNFS